MCSKGIRSTQSSSSLLQFPECCKGASVGGSGAGSGGRLAIKAGDASSSLDVSAAGGATSSGYTCGGAAGTVYVVNGTTSSLIFDNSDGSSDSSTCTLFPPELSGVQLRQLSILREAFVDLRQSVKNNDVRAYLVDVDGSSKMTGDRIVIDTSTANLRGEITCTSALELHNAQSGVGLVTADTGSSMTCSSCTVKMSLDGSHVTLQGTVSASTLEITGVERISLAGSLTANASELAIAAGSANISGTATCSGSALFSRLSVPSTLDLGSNSTPCLEGQYKGSSCSCSTGLFKVVSCFPVCVDCPPGKYSEVTGATKWTMWMSWHKCSKCCRHISTENSKRIALSEIQNCKGCRESPTCSSLTSCG